MKGEFDKDKSLKKSNWSSRNENLLKSNFKSQWKGSPTDRIK
jgi:hypothetical protein